MYLPMSDEIAKSIQADRRKEAQLAWLAKVNRANSPNFQERMGDLLIAFGQKVKTYTQANAITPALEAK